MALQGIASLDVLVSKMSGGSSGSPENAFFWKGDTSIDGNTATADVPIVGRWISLWRYDGFPSAGAVPTSSIVKPDGTTTGAIRHRIPTASEAEYILGASCQVSNVTGTLLIYDRLWSVGGVAANVTTKTTFTTDLPARRAATNGSVRGKDSAYGNIMFAEIYTAIGTTAANLTVEYLRDGTNVTSGPATRLGSTGYLERGRLIPIPINPTYGTVVAPKSVQLSISTGTAGAYGITLARPLVAIPISVANVPALVDLICNDPAITYAGGSACLSLAWLPTTATTQMVPLYGQFSSVLGADT